MMNLPLEPLRVHSLKEACVARLEGLILSGELKAGEKLPAERDLAAQLNISRPVLHEALVELAAKGLVTIQPRHGVLVNDFRTSGSVAILASLLAYHHGELDPRLVESMFAMRALIERETARLAAEQATPVQLEQLRALLERESQLTCRDMDALTALDFEFHHLVAIASGNLVYPLIINSFKSVYTHFTGLFFSRCCQTPVMDEVFAYHRQLVQAIQQRQPQAAAQIMADLLAHGEKHLKEG